jgi:hypothetical protein
MTRLIALACLLITSLSANAATLRIDASGQLTGATGVDVRGVLFDVRFMDGSCNTLFDGCDPTNYTFVMGTTLIMSAVFDQVVIGVYDTSPELVNGCKHSVCQIWFPKAYQPDKYGAPGVDVGIGQNTTGINDNLWVGAVWADFDTAEDAGSSRTYAVVSLTAVPLPAAAWLFISALGGLVVAKRKQLKA